MMELTKSHIRLIQQELNKMGLNAGPVDGIAGNKTKAALLRIPENKSTWPFKRQAIAFIQLLCKRNGIDSGKVDGYWGPQQVRMSADGMLAMETEFTAAPMVAKTGKIWD